MTAHLPPYSGEDVTCPKCGDSGASTRWSECNTTSGLWGERLVRECKRCSYAWDEATVEDAPPAGAGVVVNLNHPQEQP